MKILLINKFLYPKGGAENYLLKLGNLLEQPLEEILASPRAKAIYDGFSQRKICEELCRRCGYARRFG